MIQPTWPQIAIIIIGVGGILSAVFRVLVAGYIRQRQDFEHEISNAVASLRKDGETANALMRERHDGDIKAIWTEIQVVRETWHQQNQHTGVLIGRLSSQVESMAATMDELKPIILHLDKTVAVLTDRISDRRTDRSQS